MQEKQFTVFEGMTSISALIKAFEARPSKARRINKILYDKKNVRGKFRQINFLRAKSASLGFFLEEAEQNEIDSLSSGKTHGGFVALCEDRELPALSYDDIPENGIFYLLEGIEDPYNFGYTLRSLYAAGADGVVISERNWMSAAGVVARSSAGCSELIELYTDTPEGSAEKFKSAGYKILCANIRDSKLIYEADLEAPVLLAIGGEKRGVSRALLDVSDGNIRIGYGREFNGSLPTAEAASVIAFEVAKVNGRIK